MAIYDDTEYWYHRLPHMVAPDRALYITFVSLNRRVLDDVERLLALRSVVAGHLRSFYLHVVLAMPDHVHFIGWLYEHVTLPQAMKMIKRSSSSQIGLHRGRGGNVWQQDYFDRIIRKRDGVYAKGEYILNNPVRAGLVTTPEEWPWKWRSWVEGEQR